MDQCSSIGNIRDDIHECRDMAGSASQAGAQDPTSAAWGARQLGIHYLRRYFLLIAFRCWLEGQHLVHQQQQQRPSRSRSLSRTSSFTYPTSAAGNAADSPRIGSPRNNSLARSSLPAELSSPLCRRMMHSENGTAASSGQASKTNSFSEVHHLPHHPSTGDLSVGGGGGGSCCSPASLRGLGNTAGAVFTHWVEERKELHHLLTHLTLET